MLPGAGYLPLSHVKGTVQDELLPDKGANAGTNANASKRVKPNVDEKGTHSQNLQHQLAAAKW